MRLYAGIGSRDITEGESQSLTFVAERLAKLGYALRSGGADGADTAFFKGAGPCQILRPKHATEAAIELASQHHPAWDHCTPYVRKLMGRNAQIVLGPDLDSPVAFVACWTRAPPGRGGTRFGMRLAQANHIPVFNLVHGAFDDMYDYAERFQTETTTEG